MFYLIIISMIFTSYSTAASHHESSKQVLNLALEKDNFSGAKHGASLQGNRLGPAAPKILGKTAVENKNLLILPLIQALNDPDFRQDFKEFLKTKLGKLIIKDALASDEQAKYLISLIKLRKLPEASLVPQEIEEIMNIIK